MTQPELLPCLTGYIFFCCALQIIAEAPLYLCQEKTCELETREISDTSLISRSKIIPVCETEDCRGRVFKRGNCDVVIKNLSFSDAGKYFMRVYNHNHQTELKQQIRTYQLHIQGEELELDVNSVINFLISSTESKHPSSESKTKPDSTDEDKTDYTEEVPVIYWIMSAGLLVYTALLVSALVTLTIQKTLISKSRTCFTERGQRTMNLKDDLM